MKAWLIQLGVVCVSIWAVTRGVDPIIVVAGLYTSTVTKER